MTGKPVYKPEEIRFALDLMVQDLFNDEISGSFMERFGRDLTDNQIRYLRNKYGKDPDYGSPLVNRPANKKMKRRRAAFTAPSSRSPPPEPSPRPIKKMCRDSPIPPAVLPVPTVPEALSSQIPSDKFQDRKSPFVSSVPMFRATPPQPRIASHSPNESPYNLSSGSSIQASYTTGSSWEFQPRTPFTTNFVPINTQFGQHDASSPTRGSPEIDTKTPKHIPLQPSFTQPTYDTCSTQQSTCTRQFNNPLPTPASQKPANVQSLA
ncbi:hypothetical protein F66182_9824 [Fusarium sp. NRRL 66182]|nr:hypothetical protein F66182_9824 [Fusarium sp. NRRL 66182]